MSLNKENLLSDLRVCAMCENLIINISPVVVNEKVNFSIVYRCFKKYKFEGDIQKPVVRFRDTSLLDTCSNFLIKENPVWGHIPLKDMSERLHSMMTEEDITQATNDLINKKDHNNHVDNKVEPYGKFNDLVQTLINERHVKQ